MHPVFIEEPPRVTTHPQDLKDVVQGKPTSFTVKATGTDPLSYHWQWNPVKEDSGSEEWQPCHVEWSDGSTLTIPSVQKSNEGFYRCVINNCAGTVISNPAKLEVSCRQVPPSFFRLYFHFCRELARKT